MLGIGQSAVLLPTVIMADYGRHSETERVLVGNEGLAILSLLKIQSGPLGNLGDPPFDGDEMNMHMPQNVLAETELRHLAAIPWQLISPSNNSPIIGIFQDSMLGTYQFTRDKMKMTPREVMNLLMAYNNVDVEALNEKREDLTNYDVLSQIIPSITLKTKYESRGEDKIFEVRNGEYLSGQMAKGMLGARSNGLIHRICNEHGHMAASNFIDDLQNIVTEYMKSYSYSVGVSDLIANRETYVKIEQVVQSHKLEVQMLTGKLHLGIFENNTSKSNMSEFETEVNNILNKAMSELQKLSNKSLGANNRFLTIVNSGSKGSLINISQMLSCVGQQNIDGKRIPYGFQDRTLPHFSKFDDSPEARGFIQNSYISGLTATEIFFHAQAGRVGLIDTAVKTSQTGYIQRRLIKGLEDLKVEYDMTVRNNRSKIVQFAYGDDAFDSTRVENQAIPLAKMSVDELYMHYDIAGIHDQGSNTDLLNIYTKATITRLKKQRDRTMAKCQKYIDRMLGWRDQLVAKVFQFTDEKSVQVPVAFQHMISKIQGEMKFNSHSTVDITPYEAFELIDSLYEKLEKTTYGKPTPLFQILFHYYLSPKELLVIKRFNKKALEYLLDSIHLRYKQSLVHPGEMVGVIAGQSIGEPTTQLTLNSVVYETPIVVRNQNGAIETVEIGKFVQDHVKKSKKVEYIRKSGVDPNHQDPLENKDTTYAELCKTDQYYEVPCATEDGHTVWRRIEAVTQHPVENKDGTDTMLRIVTEGNREVIATKAKSFLQLVEGKIIGVEGAELRVGDYLPVSKKALEYTNATTLDLRTILPPHEYLYGSEMEKATNVMHEYHWWSTHYGTTFTVPHSRSDSFVSLVKANKNIHKDCVYMKLVNMCEYRVPENIELDYDFGYFIGAYAAEGCMTKHQISISNNDLDYLKPIERLCEKFNINTKIYKVCDKIQEGWISQDIRIYSTIMCRIVENLCGKLSHGKFVSDKIVFSNRECIRGFLDAYIGGDGCVCEKHDRIQSIDMTSVSLPLLTNIQIMLKNLGVVGTIHKPSKIERNNRGSKLIHQHYYLSVRNKQAQILGRNLNLTISNKQEKIVRLINQTFQYEYSKAHLTVPNRVNNETIMLERGTQYPDIIFDRIVCIEEVENTTPYAYDLTVEDTRNFDIYNGLCMRDTFHLAGVASKSNVTRGVPRIEEILRLTKNTKNQSLTIHLNPADEQDQQKAEKIASMLEHTKLVDVVESVQICFDPNDRRTYLPEDKELVDNFYAFENMVKECANIVSEDIEEVNAEKSKWILRIKLDAEKLLEKNITMDDIHYAINAAYEDTVSCVFSDYNASNLIFRLRVNSNVLDKKKRKSMDQSDEIYHLKNFQDTLLQGIVLRGVDGIRDVMPRKLQNSVVKDDGKYVQKETWVIDTTGTNLLELLGEDFIDPKRTFSNDVQEIYKVLGIEAARQSIFKEFSEVMEFSDVYINYHHMSLLADRMTVAAGMVPIFRSGILEDDIGTIAKATFEVHTEVFLDAARHANFDEMRGVSANVMCGQYGYYGTNAFNIVLDTEEMMKLKSVNVEKRQGREKIEEMFGQEDQTRDICSKNSIVIRNNVTNIRGSGNSQEMCDDDYDIGL
jgi:DNA-directed RNA polymerase beta' subunit